MNFRIHFQYCLIALSIIIILIGYSCNDSPLTSQTPLLLKQITGCQKYNLNKSASLDSCFSYTFKTELNIEFCVSGNCCPDSNRYLLSSKILGDTIEIAVRDTAANLCRCICNYLIQARFQDLNSNHYFIKCIQEESINTKVLYFKEVNRN